MDEVDPTLPTRSGSVDLKRRLVRRDGRETALSRLEAALLRYLAERPNQEVSRDELLREVWGHRRASTSRAVDFTVSRLRLKLGEPDPPEQLLTAHGVGYRFVPHDPEPAPTSTRPAGPRTLIRTARGVADLDRQSFERPDGTVVPLSRIEAAILRRLAAADGRPVTLDALASEVWGRGRHRQSVVTAIGRLRKKLEHDPARPEILVTTPGAGIRLEGETAVTGDRTNLSASGSSFVMGADVAALLQTVADHPLVTLRGTGGIGKTRLARQLGGLHLQNDPRAEVWFCDLASVSEGQGIAETVAREMGLDPAGQDLVERLGRVLARRPRRSVLILDNYEHLTAWASLVTIWRAAAPELRIWVTSRVALDLPGEFCVDVQPLDEVAAVRLFVQRSTGSTDAGSPAIRALVRRLDGLPLAIELAAARAHQLTPEGLLARIGERLDLLVRPNRDNTSHHTTLRGAFDWSWDLLEAHERRALATLSVLVSPFDTRTAAVLIGRGGEALLSQLVARSLVHREGEDRWRLFEAIREYAGEKLVLSGDRDGVLARRAALFLDRAEGWVARLDGAEAGAAHRRLRALRDEILAVYQAAADADTAARAALVVAAVEELSGPTALLAELLRGAIARGPRAELRWRLWWQLAVTSTSDEDLERARQELDRALEIAVSHSVLARTIIRRQIALNEAAIGGYAAATRVLTECRATFLGIGEPGWAARTLANVAYLHLRSTDRSPAAGMLLQAATEIRVTGEIRHLSAFLIRSAEATLYGGDRDQALAHLAEALSLARSCDDLQTQLRTLKIIGDVEEEWGAFDAANARYLELERRYRELGIVAQERAVQCGRGTLELERGNLALAEQLLEEREGEREGLHTRELRTTNLAVLRLFQGDASGARTLLRSMDQRWDRHHRFWVYANTYLAVAAALDGDRDEATERLADVRRRFDRGLWGVERFLDLCDALVDLVADPSGGMARAEAVLAAGVVVQSDDGHPIERPQDANLARRLLLRLLGRAREGSETGRYNM